MIVVVVVAGRQGGRGQVGILRGVVYEVLGH